MHASSILLFALVEIFFELTSAAVSFSKGCPFPELLQVFSFMVNAYTYYSTRTGLLTTENGRWTEIGQTLDGLRTVFGQIKKNTKHACMKEIKFSASTEIMATVLSYLRDNLVR